MVINEGSFSNPALWTKTSTSSIGSADYFGSATIEQPRTSMLPSTT